MKALALGLVACTALLGGCSFPVVDQPVVITTKPLLELTDPALLKDAKEVTGRSCNRSVLLIIPVGVATANAAYDDALAQAPGADAIVRFESRTSLVMAVPFYLESCAVVHGYAINTKRLHEASARIDGEL